MRKYSRLAIFGMLLGVSFATTAWGDEVRFYQENNITFRETRRKVPRTVYETQWQDRQVVRYRQQLTGTTRDELRTAVVPVTENRVENKLVGRWNPFVRQPYIVQKVVPTTRYEYRTTTVRVPATRQDFVPETLNERVAVPVARVVEDEIISRIAVSSPGGPPLTGAIATTWVVPAAPTALATATAPVAGVPVAGAPATGVAPNSNPAYAMPMQGYPGNVPPAAYGSQPVAAGNNVPWRQSQR